MTKRMASIGGWRTRTSCCLIIRTRRQRRLARNILTPRSLLACRRFLCVLKLPDLNRAFGKFGGDFEFSAHGAHEILERADIHISASFELGYGGLVDAENFRQMHLCHLARVAQFVERHPGAVLGGKPMRPLPRWGRHFLAKSIEVIG